MNGTAAASADAETHAQSSNGNGHHGHDDWEYEYDGTETEDIYFTLDLTTHVPDALVQKRPLFNHAVQQLSNRSDPSCDGSMMQITDLHTDRPLVRLDDAVYTCTWTTDLGTQFHISEAGTTARPRRAGTVLDIVGTSQTRLLGRPIELHSLKEHPKLATLKPTATAPTDSAEPDSDSDVERADFPEASPPSLQTAPGQQLRIPRSLCRDPAGETQAAFLERLSEIKLKKGEKDIVPIYSIRSYEAPKNMKELREQGLAADAEDARMMKDAQRLATSQRPQKRRRKMTNAEKGITPPEAGLSGRQSRRSTRARLGLQFEQSPASPGSPQDGDSPARSEVSDEGFQPDTLESNVVAWERVSARASAQAPSASH